MFAANFSPTCLRALIVLGVLALAPAGSALTRGEALEIARTFIEHRWESWAKNVRHGRDGDGVEVHTPDRDGRRGEPLDSCWLIGARNRGVAYKWGGFDTPETFDRGVRAGKAAGDVYTQAKRRLGGDAVSGDAVGIDCSGFVSRCWKLSVRRSTSTLGEISKRLTSPSELKPADIMNTAGGHVLLFVRWLDQEKKRALFYEAAPFSKTRESEHDVAEMAANGYEPLRYRSIRD